MHRKNPGWVAQQGLASSRRAVTALEICVAPQAAVAMFAARSLFFRVYYICNVSCTRARTDFVASACQTLLTSMLLFCCCGTAGWCHRQELLTDTLLPRPNAHAPSHPTGAASTAAAATEPACLPAGRRLLSNHVFSDLASAPPPAGSSAISIKVGGDGKAVTVDVRAGKASAKASYAANSIKQCVRACCVRRCALLLSCSQPSR